MTAQAAAAPAGRTRTMAGLILAPAVFFVLWNLDLPGLPESGQRTAAVWGLVIVLWLTEAVPMPVTALLGPALCVLFGVDSAKNVFRNFADPIIFLFIGSFLIAEAFVRHGVNRRMAFSILAAPWVRGRPMRVLAAYGCIGALVSMWLSNTATTAMLFPIGLAIIREAGGRDPGGRFATAMMLITAFGASIGGLGTPVGTPPNLIGIAALQKHLGVSIPFFSWMAIAFPLVVVLMAFLVWRFARSCGKGVELPAETSWLAAERARLGPASRAEIASVAAASLTLVLWLLPGAAALALGAEAPEAKTLARHLPEGVAALLGAGLLFLLPGRDGQRVLVWDDARRIDWGTILLFGGGMALGELMFSTGLAQWLGEGAARLFQARSAVALTLLFTFIAVLVSETASNTAAAIMVIPVSIAVSQAAGVPPLQPALGACLGSSLGFMLPVSTAPNAIVYSSGHVPLARMVRHGLALDLVGALAVAAVVLWWAPVVLGP